MEQDSKSLVPVPPEQYPLWPEFDASFFSYFTPNELQGYALHGYGAIMSAPCHPQHTQDFMLASVPPSAPLVPEAGLGPNLGWCIDLTAEDLSIQSPDVPSRDNYDFGPMDAGITPPSRISFTSNDSVTAWQPPAPTTLPLTPGHKKARRRAVRTGPHCVRLGTPASPVTYGKRLGQQAPKGKNIPSTVAQPSESTQPTDINVAAGSSTPQPPAQAPPGQRDYPSTDARSLQNRGNKRPRSASPGSAVGPSAGYPYPEKACSPNPSAQITYTSRSPHRNASTGQSNTDRRLSKVSSAFAGPRV